MSFEEIMVIVTKSFEAGGVAVLVIGSAYSVVRYVLDLVSREDARPPYRRFRDGLGRTILLALEILVAADIVRTLAIDTTLQSVFSLGLIVLIRTFLSFSLEIEIEGVPPWRRRQSRAPKPEPEA